MFCENRGEHFNEALQCRVRMAPPKKVATHSNFVLNPAVLCVLISVFGLNADRRVNTLFTTTFDLTTVRALIGIGLNARNFHGPSRSGERIKILRGRMLRVTDILCKNLGAVTKEQPGINVISFAATVNEQRSAAIGEIILPSLAKTDAAEVGAMPQ
jgi:hypothetical protein